MTTPFMTTLAECVEAALDQPERALHRRSIDERLDEGLELTYPASDPLAVSP